MRGSIIYESKNLCVRTVAGDDRANIVVTFDNYGIGHGFDRDGFGEKFLAGNNITAVHVMGAREDWYQYDDIIPALSTVREFTSSSSRVMTYGSSMGGYAAIRSASFLNADSTVAISPQYSIDLNVVPFEKRWISDSNRIRFLKPLEGRISSTNKPLIIYDPVGPDKLHVKLIKNDIEIRELRIPFSGHPSSTYLAESGILQELIKKELYGTLDYKETVESIRSFRRNSSVYFSTISEHARKQRPLCALDAAKKAVEISPNSDIARLSFARSLVDCGMQEEGIEEFEKLAKDCHSNAAIIIPYVDMLLRAGLTQKAMKVASELVENTELTNSAHTLGWAASVAHKTGDIESARKLFRRALSLDPGNEFYTSSLSSMSRKKLMLRYLGRLLSTPRQQK